MVQAMSENAEKPFYEQVRSSIYILMLKNSALSDSMLLYKHLNHHTRVKISTDAFLLFVDRKVMRVMIDPYVSVQSQCFGCNIFQSNIG